MHNNLERLIANYESDIKECETIIKDNDELVKALNSKQGKLILKAISEAKEEASSLMTSSNEEMRKQGIMGVQAAVWLNQHFKYLNQFADGAKERMATAKYELENLSEADINHSYEG